MNLLESAVHYPNTGFGDMEAFPTVQEKAAAIGYAIASTHPFYDGNKRMACHCMAMTLENNGYRLTVSPENALDMFWNLADGNVDKAEFFKWVTTASESMSESNDSTTCE